MQIQRSKNAKRNIFVGIINKIVTILLPFIVRTVTIKSIGVEYLGLNSLFSSILQVLNLTELGFSGAIVYCMYRPIAEGDNKTLCALYNYFKKIYKLIGIIILIFGIILTPFIPYLINGSVPRNVNIYIVYWIFLLNTVITYWLYAYKSSIPNAMQRTDLVNSVSMITVALMYIGQIVVLLVLENYYLSIILMPISTILNNILLSYVVDRTFPNINCYGQISKEIKKEIKVKLTGLMINKICQISRNSFDSICVSAFLGLTVTAMYNNYYYIINALIGFTTIIIQSLTAGVGNSVILNSIEKNYADMRKMNFWYMWLGGFMTICLLCLYQPFMEIWMGNDYLFPYGVVVVFSIYFYSLKMGDVRGLYSDANGLWWENRFRAIAESIVNIVLNVFLGYFAGVYGIIVGTLISLLIINFGFGSKIVFKYYFKNGKMKEYFLDHFKYAFVTSIVALCTIFLCNSVFGNEWLILIVRAIICLIVPNMLYFLIYRKTQIFSDASFWLLEKIRK